MSELRDVSERVVEERKLELIVENDHFLYAQRAGLSVIYQDTGVAELFEVRKYGESDISVVELDQTIAEFFDIVPDITSMAIAKGCLPDYLTLLSGSDHYLPERLVEEFTPWLDVHMNADSRIQEVFIGVGYHYALHVVDLVFPYENF